MKKVIIAAVLMATIPGSAQASNWAQGEGHCNTSLLFPGLGWLGFLLYRPCVGVNNNPVQ